jgi:hypothetical protein
LAQDGASVVLADNAGIWRGLDDALAGQLPHADAIVAGNAVKRIGG